MFRTKTAFVIGAGASHEFGLPVGSKLAEIISEKCDVIFEDFGRPTSGDHILFNCFQQEGREKSRQFQNAAWAIRDGILLQNSIDDFLLSKNDKIDIVRYGKAAIVKSILEAERSSKLYYDPHDHQKTLNIKSVRQTWVAELTRILFLGANNSTIDTLFENVCFIVFNYDRCLEYFLLWATQKYFEIDQDRARLAVSKAKIFHPYGSVGPLQGLSLENDAVPFGGRYNGKFSSDNFFRLANNIRVYTEHNATYDDYNDAGNCLLNYSRIVFLGFGFHEQNIKLLFNESKKGYAPKIVATTFGISDENVEYIRSDICNSFHPEEVHHVDLKLVMANEQCGELFRRYNKLLTR